MVIQSNMSPEDIVGIGEATEYIFEKYEISITKQPLEIQVEEQHLSILLKELNYAIGSSSATCIEGG